MATNLMMDLRLMAAGAVLAIVAAGGPTSASAQALTYTEAQAAAGANAFRSGCSGCHGAQAQGAEAPALFGAQFDGNWRGVPAASLYDFISQLMPADKPGSLTKDAYVSIMAHLFKLNGIPAGTAPLPIPPPPDMMIPK